MNWEAIGAVGEIMGALGVIASLMYLALQIRHSNKVTRATTYHEITKDVRELNHFGFSHPEYFPLMTKANNNGVNSLADEELNQWMLYMGAFLVVFENCFHAGREGVAHEEMWPSARRALKGALRQNHSAREWFEISDSLTTSFRAEVAKICAEIDAEADNQASL